MIGEAISILNPASVKAVEETAKAAGEVAKVAGKGVDAATALAQYAAGVLGTAPKTFFGLAVGDWLYHQRVRNWARLNKRTAEILSARGASKAFEEPSPVIAEAIVNAAADESREELAELWAKLLATSMDPARRNAVRRDLIEAVRKMEPLDALIFDLVSKHGNGPWSPSGRDVIAQSTHTGVDDVLVSFANLEACHIFHFIQNTPKINPYLAPAGNLLARAIA